MKKNRVKWFVLVVAAMLAIPVFGQQSWRNNRHEIRLGVGIVPMTSSYSFGYKDYLPAQNYSADFYKGDKTFTPAINLTYSYQFRKWLSLGATLTYAGVYQNSYDLLSDKLRGKYRDHYIGLTPTVRFDYLNREFIRLYSAFGFGIGMDMERDGLTKDYYSGYSNRLIPTIDMTWFGVAVGRKIYGFCELGIGFNGFLKAGIGYRFNSKKHRQS